MGESSAVVNDALSVSRRDSKGRESEAGRGSAVAGDARAKSSSTE